MKKRIFRIITLFFLFATIMFSSIGSVNADNPNGNYYHKILPNGKCVDQRFKSPADANQHGFNLLGPCPEATATSVVPTSTNVIPSPTEIIPTETEIIPTATEILPTATEIIPTETEIIPTATQILPTETEILPTETRVIPTPTNFVITPTFTNVPTKTSVPTNTSLATSTSTNVPSNTPTAIATDRPNSTKTPTAIVARNLATPIPNCPQNNNGFLPWIFLVLGGVGTGLAISTRNKIKSLLH